MQVHRAGYSASGRSRAGDVAAVANVPTAASLISKMCIRDRASTAVLLSVVGAFYYLRVIWYMYFEPAAPGSTADTHFGTRFALTLNTLAVLALGLLPNALFALCNGLID